MKYECLDWEKAIKYIDGILSPQETAYYKKHTKACKECSREIEKAKGIEKILHLEGTLAKRAERACQKIEQMERELRAEGCILTEEMTDFLYDRVPLDRKKYIESHLKRCDECREFLVIFKEVEKEFGQLKC